jgi:aerobic C4-dicarboxylate transport protein
VAEARPAGKPLLGSLYRQVIAAVLVGIALGFVYPTAGAAMKPLGDGFIKLIRMIIPPIVFVTIVGGIARMHNVKEVGRIGIRALVYFEVVSTLALVIGLIVGEMVRPGAGINADPATLDPKAIEAYTTAAARAPGTVAFFLDLIPTTVVDAFARGQVLQIVVFSILFGFALLRVGERGRYVLTFVEQLGALLGPIMRVAPLGAFGAIAFTVGAYGLSALLSLAKLMAAFYTTCLLFTIFVLGPLSSLAGFNLWRLLVYIKEEILIVLATSNSEVALPKLLEKLERLGAPRSLVGLVLPTGYSFNQDGVAIYLTMATLFIAQALNVPLTLGEKLTILGVLMVTSKGSAGVSGAGFVILAATLASTGTLPVAGMTLLLGVERFMSEARALMTLIGNAVATLVVARWVGALDMAQLQRELQAGPALPSVPVPQPVADPVAAGDPAPADADRAASAPVERR